MLELQTGGGKPVVKTPRPTTTKTTTSKSNAGAASSASGKTSISSTSKSPSPTTATRMAVQPKPTGTSAAPTASGHLELETVKTVISAATSALLHAIQPTGVDTDAGFCPAYSSFVAGDLALLSALEPGRPPHTQARKGKVIQGVVIQGVPPSVRALPAGKRTVPTQARKPVVPTIKRVARANKGKSSPPVDHTVRGLLTARASASTADYARTAPSRANRHESLVSGSNKRASTHSETLNHAIGRMLAHGRSQKEVAGQVHRWHPDWSTARVTSAVRAAGNPGAAANTNLHRPPTARVHGTPVHASSRNTPRQMAHWEPGRGAGQGKPAWQTTPYYPGQRPTSVGRGVLYKNPEHAPTISEISTVGLTPAQLAYMRRQHSRNATKSTLPTAKGALSEAAWLGHEASRGARWTAHEYDKHASLIATIASAAAIISVAVAPELAPWLELLAASASADATRQDIRDRKYGLAVLDSVSAVSGLGGMAADRAAVQLAERTAGPKAELTAMRWEASTDSDVRWTGDEAARRDAAEALIRRSHRLAAGARLVGRTQAAAASLSSLLAELQTHDLLLSGPRR